MNCELPLPAFRGYGRTLELPSQAGSSGTQQASCSGLSGPRVCSWDEVCPRQTQWRRAGKTSHPRLTWNQIRLQQATCSELQWRKEAEQLLQSVLPQKTPKHPKAPPAPVLPNVLLLASVHKVALKRHMCNSRLPSLTCRTSGGTETVNHRPHLWPWKPSCETARDWSDREWWWTEVIKSATSCRIPENSECILLQGMLRAMLGSFQDLF